MDPRTVIEVADKTEGYGRRKVRRRIVLLTCGHWVYGALAAKPGDAVACSRCAAEAAL